MQDEDVRQGPETELDAALLKLLTVRTAPGVIRSELDGKNDTRLAFEGSAQQEMKLKVSRPRKRAMS